MLYTLFVGVERDALNKPILAAEYRDMLTSAERETAEQFGGFTVTKARGGWISPKNDLIREDSLKFEVSIEDPVRDDSKVREWARWMRKRFRQASVMLTCTVQGTEYINND